MFFFIQAPESNAKQHFSAHMPKQTKMQCLSLVGFSGKSYISGHGQRLQQ
jgi:hypothetical protein